MVVELKKPNRRELKKKSRALEILARWRFEKSSHTHFHIPLSLPSTPLLSLRDCSLSLSDNEDASLSDNGGAITAGSDDDSSSNINVLRQMQVEEFLDRRTKIGLL